MRRLQTPAFIVAGLGLALVATLLVFKLPLAESTRLIFEGALSDKFGWSRSLVKAIPLMLTGLGMVVAWRAGMFNIGGEGQLLMGAVTGAAIAKPLIGVLPGAVLNPLILIAACTGGALTAGLAGWLYVRRGVQVVISTILLNFVAMNVLQWLVTGPLQESKGQVPLTDKLPADAMLARFDRQLDLHWGIFIGILAALALYVYLYFTKDGFKLRLVGESPNVARANRISVSQVQLKAMLLSGALCGLAGGVEYTGMAGQVGADISQNWGFLAIPVALLGGLHPLGVVGSSVLFGALIAGSENLSRFMQGSSSLILIVQAVSVLAYVSLQAVKRPSAAQEGT